MRTWNVRRSVVELVKAETPEDAYAKVSDQLRAAGFEPCEADDYEVLEGEE